MDEGGAEAELIQKDYWNPAPGQPSEEIRKAKMRGRAGQKCRFAFGPQAAKA